MSDVEIGKQYRTEGWIARNRYNRHPRTVQRWQRDPRVGFPKPDLEILGVKYWTDETLDRFDERNRPTAA